MQSSPRMAYNTHLQLIGSGKTNRSHRHTNLQELLVILSLFESISASKNVFVAMQASPRNASISHIHLIGMRKAKTSYPTRASIAWGWFEPLPERVGASSQTYQYRLRSLALSRWSLHQNASKVLDIYPCHGPHISWRHRRSIWNRHHRCHKAKTWMWLVTLLPVPHQIRAALPHNHHTL